MKIVTCYVICYLFLRESNRIVDLMQLEKSILIYRSSIDNQQVITLISISLMQTTSKQNVNKLLLNNLNLVRTLMAS